MRFFLFSLVFLLFSTLGLAAPQEGQRVRQFLHDIVISGGIEDSAERANFLKSTIAEHLDLFPLLLNESTAEELLKDSDLQWSLSLVTKEGDSKATIFTVLSEQIQALSDYLGKVSFKTLDPSILKAKGLLKSAESKISADNAKKMSEVIRAVTTSQKTLLVDSISNKMLFALSDGIDETIAEAKFSRIPALAPIMEEMKQAKINGFSPEDMQFLSDSFMGYFDKMNPRKKRQIIGAWINLPPGTSTNKQLAEVLQNVGPVLQKIFQFTGRDAKSPEIRELMKELLADVRPFPTEVARAQIEVAMGRPIEEVFSAFDEKPLKAGTIGQIYGATLKADGRKVIVKVKRPNLDKEMAEEFELFDELTKKNKVANSLIMRLKSNFSAELNFLTEANNLREAVIYNDKKLGITVPKIIEEIPPDSGFLVMERAAGSPMADAMNIDPKLRSQALYNSLKKWFEIAMFKTGFFHGDLHPGNMLIRLTGDKKNPFEVSFIDLGSAGKLPLKQRRQFLLLYAAVIEGYPETILQEMSAIGTVPEEAKAGLLKDYAKILEEKTAPMLKLEDILSISLQRGVEVDPNLVMFSRADLFLANELKAINAEVIKKLPKEKVKDAGRAYMSVAVRQASADFPKELIGLGTGEELLDSAVMRRMFVAHVRQMYSKTKDNCAYFFHIFSKSNNPAGTH